jgi:hypothetical protein
MTFFLGRAPKGAPVRSPPGERQKYQEPIVLRFCGFRWIWDCPRIIVQFLACQLRWNGRKWMVFSLRFHPRIVSQFLRTALYDSQLFQRPVRLTSLSAQWVAGLLAGEAGVVEPLAPAPTNRPNQSKLRIPGTLATNLHLFMERSPRVLVIFPRVPT